MIEQKLFARQHRPEQILQHLAPRGRARRLAMVEPAFGQHPFVALALVAPLPGASKPAPAAVEDERADPAPLVPA